MVFPLWKPPKFSEKFMNPLYVLVTKVKTLSNDKNLNPEIHGS